MIAVGGQVQTSLRAIFCQNNRPEPLQYYAFRKLAYLAEYSPEFRMEIYNCDVTSSTVWQDIYEVMIKEIYCLNEKISAKLKSSKPIGARV